VPPDLEGGRWGEITSFSTAVAMALPSGKDLCPKCGGLLEPGFVRGDAGNFSGIPSTIRWEPMVPVLVPGESDEDTRLARLPIFRFQESPRFPAVLCPACHVVEFQFTDRVRARFP
jgi:hypothetical protein